MHLGLLAHLYSVGIVATCLIISSKFQYPHFDMAIEVFLKIFASHPRLVLFLDLLKFVLKNNIFQLSANIYHQVCGIAMGTTMAPALASIVVAYYEEKYLNSLYLKPLVWLRYIDDVSYHDLYELIAL